MIYISPPIPEPSEPGLEYVDRGDPAAFDFVKNDLTTDDTYNELDLSGIVDTGSVLVVIRTYIQNATVQSSIAFRKKGNSNDKNIGKSFIPVSNRPVHSDIVVALSADLKVEYNASNNVWTQINLTIAGWFL